MRKPTLNSGMESKLGGLPVLVRPATAADRSELILAIAELQLYESRLHDSRQTGSPVAEVYLGVIEARSADLGAIFVAEEAGRLVGFVAGWVEQAEEVAETADSNRFGYISDICVMPDHRGRGIATLLLSAIEKELVPTIAEA